MIGARLMARLPAALRTALMSSAQTVADNARTALPARTGTLANSIKVKVTDNAAEISATAPYAVLHELGSATRSAQPFLRPALLAEQTNLRARVYAALRENAHG